MNKTDFTTVATPELIEMVLANEEILKILTGSSEDELVVINNDYKLNNKWMPHVLKAVLCNIKICITNAGITDIEISKIHNNDELYVKQLYKTLIEKYSKDYQSIMNELGEPHDNSSSFIDNIISMPEIQKFHIVELKELVKKLMVYYIKMNEDTNQLTNLYKINILLKTQLEEKSDILQVLYESKSLSSGILLRYIRQSHSKINEIKNKLTENKNDILSAESEKQNLLNTIQEIEVKIIDLLTQLEGYFA